MSAEIEKKRVDWGTVKSMSGRINKNLSSTPKRRMTPKLGTIDDRSITEFDELGQKPDTSKGEKSLKTGGGNFAEIGHDTDKTQIMQVSSRTLNELASTESDVGGGPDEGGFGDEEEDTFRDNETRRRTPQRRLSLTRRPSVEDLYESIQPAKIRCLRLRMMCGKIVNNPKFQIFIILLIIINSLMMGIGTFDFVMDNPDVAAIFEIIDMVFLIIFTVEIFLQLVFRGLRLFTDGWLVFDFVIVVMSWSLSSLQIIRAFRVFRALRLITRVDTLRKLVTALMEVLPKMSAIGMLLVLIFYIFAVMFTVLFKDLYELGFTEEDYFSSLQKTLFTLMQMMTMDWSEVARQCMAVYPWAWMPFLLFVAVSGFIVFNLIIAVVCDAVATVEHQGEEEDDDDAGEDVNNASSYHRSGCISGASEYQSEKVRELRSRVDLLLQKQLEMQCVVQTLVDGMQNDAEPKPRSVGCQENEDNFESSSPSATRDDSHDRSDSYSC